MRILGAAFSDPQFAALHDKSPFESMNELAAEELLPILRAPWRGRLSPRRTVVAASGVADDVDHVAAELSAD
jgi:hypothetical protein